MIDQWNDAKRGDCTEPELLPEIWGGIECTINRVGDTYSDQLAMAGHYTRDTDIDLIAGLGIRKLRFPVLWEKHEHDEWHPIDWSWTDKRLGQLQAHGITPIVGLVHHGSGPVFTNLGANSFASGLAEYAAKVAQRYPWLEYYTPVNEPLTTARFSGLYGYWYPHKKSDAAFCTMLLNQIKATVLAMQEIRRINPEAKLIQTEDIGKTYAVPALQYQADFDNDRRWISFDLLCGKVDEHHPIWDFFIRSGVNTADLRFFLENPCPPSVIGLNYYVTSERFLDNRLENYSRHMHGGNLLERYVDTEAIRVNHGLRSGLKVLLREVEDRYNLPIAITESHLHCTAEERIRWFKETLDICCELKRSGSSIEAVTVWSLFGAFGWNKLLTNEHHEYESGAFDLRGGSPRPTAMAKAVQAVCKTRHLYHPVLEQKGWWHRCDRFSNKEGDEYPEVVNQKDIPALLIIGNDGPMLRTFTESAQSRSLSHELLLPEDGLYFQKQLTGKVKRHRYWAIIHLAEGSHSDESFFIAEMCKQMQVQFLSVGTGRTNEVLGINAYSLIIQTGKLFDADTGLDLIRAKKYNNKPGLINSADHKPSGFSYVPDVTNVALDLLIDGEHGVWKLIHDESSVMPSLENALSRCNAKRRAAHKYIFPVHTIAV